MGKVKSVGKFLLAGLVAFVILCLVTSLYSLTPLRIESAYGNTDYVWKQDFPWIKMTEGISYGVVDNQGFNNLEVVDNPDILLLGSSHIEAMNVMQNHSTSSVLNEKFEGEYSTYNMGISGHTLFKVVQYLPKSLSVYDTVPKYIVIETDTTILNGESVTQALNGEVPVTKVNNEGLVAWLQKFPFLRSAYHQLDNGMMDVLLPSKQNDNQEGVPNDSYVKPEIDKQPYEDMFSYLHKLQTVYDTKIIIVYHPFEHFNDDGEIYFNNKEYTEVFDEYAEKNDICFIDMTEAFKNLYYKENQVPHGFSTGALGEGHLNKYGHEAIANEIYRYITDVEVQK